MKQKTHKFQLPLRKRAESLIETIVAISVLAIGATATAILVRTSILGNELSQDRMFALSLAQEGIEGVRSIRDTNWLRFSSNKDECWNASPILAPDITDCHTKLIDPDTYTLNLDLTTDVLAYYLDASGGTVFDAGNRIYECEIENYNASDIGLLYASPDNTSDYTEIDFYRQITIDYDPNPPGDPETSNLMVVTSEVGWYTDGNQKTVTLTEYIGNW